MEDPKKLKRDAIAEALLEMRFVQSGSVPELVLGKLASFDRWRHFVPHRLPVADIPAPVRQQDPSLQFMPLLELRGPDNSRSAKIGDAVVSYHALPPYPGWELLQPEFEATFNFVFSALNNVNATRLGFRYINVFTADHFVSGIADLNLKIDVASEPLGGPIILNYQRTLGAEHTAMVRIASREFVLNPVPPNLTALVDIDIYTLPTFQTTSAQDCMAWVEEAHVFLKREFFRLLTTDLVSKLVKS